MQTRHLLTAAVSIAAAAAGVAALQGPATSAPGSAQGSAQAKAAASSLHFTMGRSGGAIAANCLAKGTASVTVTPQGETEAMTVKASHLPPNQEFDLFVLQAADAPFGMAWYQGDLDTDSTGAGTGRYVGRFNVETFMVATGPTAAPVVHPTGTFPDANTNPVTKPIHMFHLGLWFGSPAAAKAAGCPTTLTPFNGDHTAGIQALSTRTFPALNGPLRSLTP